MRRSDISAEVWLYLRSEVAQSHARGMGRGIVDLCERVEATGSLNRAAGEMGMAYSKAWRIVKNTEDALGVELFVRKGARGSSLTDAARILITLYRRMEQELARQAEAMLDAAFAQFAERGMLSDAPAPEIEKKATPELIAQVRALEGARRPSDS